MDDHPQDGIPSPDDTTRSPAAEGGIAGDYDLLVPWLRIQNFRGFRDLHIPRLGRVNLIVGKNSVGKSTVLEALQIHFDRTTNDRPLKILARRMEKRFSTSNANSQFRDNVEKIIFNVESLFHKKPAFGFKWPNIVVSNSTHETYISFGFLEGKPDFIFSVVFDDVYVPEQSQKYIPTNIDFNGVLNIFNTYNHVTYIVFSDNLTIHDFPDSGHYARRKNIVYLDPFSQTDMSAAEMWERIALTDIEDHVIAAVRIVIPDVERVAILGTENERVFVTRVRNTPTTTTLNSLGDGAVRLFNIALALGNARDGILLLDEAENGLHWSVHPKLWDLVFHLAETLNVQVFATTHSYDCIKGFAAAARKHPAKGALVRLERNGDDVSARVLDEDAMTYAVEEDIEVR